MIEQIEEAKEDVAAGKEPKTTVRELLRWFGSKRRRTGVVDRIKTELRTAGLSTAPDFTSTWIDGEIVFRKLETQTTDDKSAPKEDTNNGTSSEIEQKDAAHLIGMLEAANRKVISVNPQDTLEKAVTLMLAHDFSQLAVIVGERELKGVISWKSIGSRLTQKNSITEVRHAMDEAHEIKDTESLFEATKIIIQRDFVFVRASSDNRITGIVTATDLSEQFQRLSEPFLLLGQIENQIRNMITGIFDLDTLRACCNENDPERQEKVESVADLTFGEYIRLLENVGNWAKLGIVADRKTFCSKMNDVRIIRNDVMHFDPDGIDDEQFDQLRKFSRLLDELARLAAPRVR